MVAQHAAWSSRFAFIMAAVGSAVGLGNVWKFPYMAGSGGGAAFVLVYLGCVLLVGVPILVAELMLGRRGGRDPVSTMATLGAQHSGSAAWGLVGGAGVVTALFVLSFYSVIAGWALAYVPKALLGGFAGADGAATQATFGALLGNPLALLGWHTAFMAMTVFVVAGGVRGGVERASTWLMPALFAMLLVLVGYGMVAGDFARGAAYLLQPDFSKIDGGVVLAAAGQAFFSLSIGLGTMLAYGSYLPAGVSIPRTSVVIALCDTACAVLAGLAVFPIVFAFGLDPSEGPGLVFVTLPVAFGQMPAGALFGAVFFALLVVAALTSAVSLLEPVVAWGTGRHGGSRGAWCLGVGTVAWALGFLTIFSFNLWAEVRPLGGERTVFDWIDYLTSSVMLPLGGVLLALFAGWLLPREVAAAEFGADDAALFRVWRFLVRVVAPLSVVGVLLDRLL